MRKIYLLSIGLLGFLTISTSLSRSASASAEVPKMCQAVSDYSKDNYIMNLGDRLLAKPEFNYYWGISDEDRANLSDLQSMLKKYHINILALPIPYQAAIYINDKNNPAPNFYNAQQATKAYETQVQNLNSHGFYTVNLDTLAKGVPSDIDFFAKRDHHWTGQAMELVADKVKSVVDKANLDIDRSAQTSLKKTIGDYNGSIADDLDRSCGFKFSVPEKRTFFDLSIKTNESLLGDTNSDVVMVGDSFSIPYFGFDKVVSDKLKTPITNVSINGGGCCASINGYFSGLKPQDAKPKLIIWTALMVLTNSNETRELKPSIYQAYEPITSIKQLNGKRSSDYSWAFNTNLNKAKKYFVKVKIDGPKTEDLHLIFDYGKDKEDVTLYRKSEEQKPVYSTEFYYELKDGVDAVKSITTGVKKEGNYTVSLHQYK